MDIRFIYSNQYEVTLNPKGQIQEVLTREKIKELGGFWKEYGEKIESTFKEISRLSFKSGLIKCYLNSTSSLSDPLSLKIEDTANMYDNLIHELSHIILSENNVGDTKGWKELQEDFKNEHPATRAHLLIHSIHSLITKKLFPQRMSHIENYSQWDSYKRSWEIVNQIGAQELIDKYLFNKK